MIGFALSQGVSPEIIVSRVRWRRAGRPIRHFVEDCADEPYDGVVIWKDADDVSSAFELALSRLGI